MQLRFTLRKTFTTTLSAAEATTAIQELLNRRSKILFFSFAHYSGSIKGNEFTLFSQKNDRFGLSTFKIKGNIRTENPTTIDTRIVPPYMIICIFLVCVGITLPAILFADEMTINGVHRAPELSERIGFSLFMLFVPSVIFYMNSIRPLKKVEARLKEVLKLEGKH